MSVNLICIGFLFFAITIGDAMQEKDEIHLKRNRRSLTKLNGMFYDVTGHEGSEFLNYGNWCGFGGSGKAVDLLDVCCQNHDICYDELMNSHCKEQKNAVYSMNYEWKKIKNGEASCGVNDEMCSATLCLCDVVLVNCLKENLSNYNTKNLHKMSFYELLTQGNYIANM